MTARDDADDQGPLGRLVADAHGASTSMDTAARHLWSIEREATRLQRRRRRQRLVSMTASVLLLVGSVGTLAGTATALPGDALYSLKGGLERTELAVAFTDAATARAHLRHARERLSELEATSERSPDAVDELAERFFAALDRAAEVGGDALSSEVAALRTSGMLLLDRVAADHDHASPQARGASATRDAGSARGSDGAASPVSDRRGGGDDRPTGGDDGSAGGGPEAAEPISQPPETSVADTPADSDDETDTASTPEETGTAQSADGEDGDSAAEDSEDGDSAGEDGDSAIDDAEPVDDVEPVDDALDDTGAADDEQGG